MPMNFPWNPIGSGEMAGPHRADYSCCQILGVRFFCGEASAAVQRMRKGGLLVAPAAPALADLPTNAGYREALLNADLAIADSGLMVLVWNLLESTALRRLSGLEYLRELLKGQDLRQPHQAFWIMGSAASAERNIALLGMQGIEVDSADTYIAPMYVGDIRDSTLVKILSSRRPQHVIVTIGGGAQERLGFYLRQNLDYVPAIHCIGAAIAFLSGDQVNIPVWADKAYLGWLFRCVSNPMRYVPRYWRAGGLLKLLCKYRSRCPVDEF